MRHILLNNNIQINTLSTTHRYLQIDTEKCMDKKRKDKKEKRKMLSTINARKVFLIFIY